MGSQVTLVPVELVWMALKAFLGYRDTQAGRVPQGMSFLTARVLQAHLDSLELLGQADLVAFLEAQGLQVSFIYIEVNTPKNNHDLGSR